VVFDFEFAVGAFFKICAAIPMTLLISVVSMLIGLVIGYAATLCRMYKIPVLQRISAVYVSLIRGTPLLVLIYIVYYGIPLALSFLNQETGWNISVNGISPLAFALVAFSINTGAYLAEVIRSALGAVDPGQMEAAYSVGMTAGQGMRRIVLPQALLVALPNLGNTFLGFIKGTSLAYTVMVVDIMAVAKVEAADGYRYLEAFVDAAIIYWLVSIVFEKLFALAEKRIARHRGQSLA